MKKIIIFIFILCCSLVYSQEATPYILEANDLYKNGKYEEALELLDKEIEQDEVNLNARYARSFIFIELKKDKEALKDLDYILTYEPSNLKARHQRAKANYDLANYEAALKDINYLLDRLPYNSLSLSLRGLIKSAMGEKDAALIDLDYAILYARIEDKNTFSYYYNRASFYYDEKKFNLAMKDVDKSLLYNPHFINSLVLKSRLCYENSDLYEAIEVINTAIDIDPNDKKLYYYRILYSLDNEDITLAKKDLDVLQSWNIDSADYHYLLGEYYVHKKNYKKAVEELNIYKQKKEDNGESVLFIVQVSFENGIPKNVDEVNFADLE